MRIRFETLFRFYWLVLAAMLVWAVWASAQGTGTNGPDPASVPAAGEGRTLSERAAALLDRGMEPEENHLTFGLENVPFLRDTAVAGQPLWKYVASLLYVFLAFYLSKTVDFLARVVLKRWAVRTATQFDDLLLQLLNGPVKVVVFVVLLHVGLDVFTWPVWVERLMSQALKIVVALSLTYLALKVVDLLLGLWKKRVEEKQDEQFHKQLFPIIGKSVKAFVVIVAFLVTAPHLGLNITGLIASLSIGGLAVGLAAQDTLANLFGAVAVLVDKPFHVGDRILLDSVDGVVETIGFRSTRVRNLDGHLVTIPNKAVGNATITNITQRPNIRTLMNLGVTYGTTPEGMQRAVAILKEVYGKHPNTHDLIVSFNKFADFALNILVVHWWNNTDYRAYLAGLEAMNVEVKRRFDAEGIEFAFPTQTLHMRQEGEWRLMGEGQPPRTDAAT